MRLSVTSLLLAATSAAHLLSEAQASVAPAPGTAATTTLYHNDDSSIINGNTHSHNEKRLTEDTMSQNIRKMEYAVRGKIVIAADKIADELQQMKQSHQPNHKYNFDHIVYTNIGNPQSVGQAPLTWPRQVMALVDLPASMGVDHPLASQLFPSDAIDRAREIKRSMPGGSSGAYSHSKGIKALRDDVAHFITERDGGIATDADDIFLTNGASAAITMILCALVADSTWYVTVCWTLQTALLFCFFLVSTDIDFVPVFVLV